MSIKKDLVYMPPRGSHGNANSPDSGFPKNDRKVEKALPRRVIDKHHCRPGVKRIIRHEGL